MLYYSDFREQDTCSARLTSSSLLACQRHRYYCLAFFARPAVAGSHTK